jgi:exoribonuclease R
MSRAQEGIVVQVLDKAFDIYLPYLGVEKRIYMDKLSEAGVLEAYEYQKEHSVLNILWAGGARAVMPEEGARLLL